MYTYNNVVIGYTGAEPGGEVDEVVTLLIEFTYPCLYSAPRHEGA